MPQKGWTHFYSPNSAISATFSRFTFYIIQSQHCQNSVFSSHAYEGLGLLPPSAHLQAPVGAFWRVGKESEGEQSWGELQPMQQPHSVPLHSPPRACLAQAGNAKTQRTQLLFINITQGLKSGVKMGY